MPVSRNRSASEMAKEGLTVLVSMMLRCHRSEAVGIVPCACPDPTSPDGFAPAATIPRSLSKTTSSIASCPVRHKKIVLHSSATARGEDASVAPSSTRACAFSYVRLNAITGTFCVSSRLTIAVPSLPVPIQPIFSISLSPPIDSLLSSIQIMNHWRKLLSLFMDLKLGGLPSFLLFPLATLAEQLCYLSSLPMEVQVGVTLLESHPCSHSMRRSA